MTSQHRPGPVLTIMARAGDAELWAGGTLLVHSGAARVDVTVERTDARQLAEAEAAAGVIGARLHVVPSFTSGACVDLLRRHQPEVVITHDPDDPDDAHRRVAAILRSALPFVPPYDLPRQLYRYETRGTAAAGAFALGAKIVDVTHVYERKLRALSAYEAFAGSGYAGLVERRSQFWGVQVGAERAEAFVPLPILDRRPAASHL